MIASIRGHNLYYEIGGPEKGTAVVLLHHGLGSTRAWRLQVPVLAAAGYRVLAYDRWGYGASDARSSLSMPYFEEDLEDFSALVAQLGLERFSLVGHSDGGTIALYIASRWPQRVRSLVTVAAHVYIEPKMVPALPALRDQFERSEVLRMGLGRVHGEKYNALFYSWIDGWTQERYRDWDMRPLLSGITCPALVVQGELDEHATPQHARDLAAALPGAELWLVPGAHHMLPQDNADIFNPRLVNFLDEDKKS